ncbi:hypothetical protein [Photobacterium aquae]|uniref:hypothetical protein n=1 Tax=Photobacterium aquae TaxID=1195763 RepID=UPI000B25CC6C|nr:hypothetical protein [Photobacterium aquae]
MADNKIKLRIEIKKQHDLHLYSVKKRFLTEMLSVERKHKRNENTSSVNYVNNIYLG